MTLASLLADLYRRERYGASPSAAVAIRLTAFLNETHRELMTLPGMERLRDDRLLITALANQARLGLPPSIARIQSIVDKGNNHKLRQVPLPELRLMDPAQAFVGGFPLQYALVGSQAVQIQPATTGLWVASSSASDTTQHVFVESIVTGGYPQTVLPGGTALTGTTRVQIGTRTDHLDVTKLYLDTTAIGFVSLYDAAVSGNELARLPIGKLTSRYLAVEWYPVQTVDTPLYADVTRTIHDLVNAADEPLLPADLHYVVGLGARVKEYEYLDDSRLIQARTDYLIGQRTLKSWVLNDGDRIASLRRTPMRWSQLGSQYPSGS